MKRHTLILVLFVLMAVAAAPPSASAQPVAVQPQILLPVASPYASISERVGITHITVNHGRPAVNGRQIWGGVVPYGEEPMPWRVGANENTTIVFEHDVLVEGQPLAAGTYGLHMAPGENTWVVIFSHNATSWGSFSYQKGEDALRVRVQPEAAEHTERLKFEFTDHQGTDEVTLAMRWERLRVPLRIKIQDVHETVMAQARLALRNRPGFTWQGFAQAAGYALQNNVNRAEALQWADQALQQNRSFSTLALKAGLLQQTGAQEEADALMAEAIPTSTENQLNGYGYQLMGQQRMEEALEIFKLNVERHPEAWNPHDSLGECYAAMGDTRNARKYYRLALEKLPEGDQVNKQRIDGILAGLN